MAAYRSFADLLNSARRQSQLRGTSLPSSAVRSMGSGYFADAADAANTDRSYALAEAGQTLAERSQASQEAQNRALLAQNQDIFAATLAQQKAEMAAQQEAAKAADLQGNITTGVSALGTGATLLKGTDLGNSIVNTGKAALGKLTGSVAPAAAGAFAGEAAMDAGLTAAMDAGVGNAAGMSAAELSGSTAGSILGSLATPISYAAPYYAAAKLGGMAINSITDNNPDLKETPFGRLGGSLEEPLAVEQYWATELADHGVGNQGINEYFLSEANPLEVGGWIKDTTDKALNTFTGNLYTPVKALLGSLFGGDNEEQKRSNSAGDYVMGQANASGDPNKFLSGGNANRLYWNIMNGKAWSPDAIEGVDYSNDMYTQQYNDMRRQILEKGYLDMPASPVGLK